MLIMAGSTIDVISESPRTIAFFPTKHNTSFLFRHHLSYATKSAFVNKS